MVIHRLWRSVVERRDHIHVFEAVFRRWRILIRCQRELDFQAADAAAIPDVNLAQLTWRWRRGQPIGQKRAGALCSIRGATTAHWRLVGVALALRRMTAPEKLP